jgi:SAM-dependent methyltransferase
MTSYLAPGHILQHEALWDELKELPTGSFLEAGCGIGQISNYLLEKGWKGIGVDLNKNAIQLNKTINKKFIDNQNYDCLINDFTNYEDSTTKVSGYDLVISSNVIEHLEEPTFTDFLNNMVSCTKENGQIIIIVPASPKDWGIEDEVVGHIKRYTHEDLKKIARDFNIKPINIYGITYPLSNMLLGLSNYLVKKNEGHKLSNSDYDNTIESSLRKNSFKTEFPNWTRLLINRFILYPFILLQKLFKKHPRSLILLGRFSKYYEN